MVSKCDIKGSSFGHKCALLRSVGTLLPGEKELITEFQDETCFQGNDFKSSTWFEIFIYLDIMGCQSITRLQAGQQILMTKRRGRLMHDSKFMEEVNGRLVLMA